MGPRRRCAVALVLILAGACGGPPSDERTVAAAGGAGLEQLPATTTSVAPPTSTSTTTARPAPNTTSTRPAPTTTTAVYVPPKEVIGTTSAGENGMVLSVAPTGPSVQVKVTIAGPGHVAGVRIDMGDGTVLNATPATDRLCGAPPVAVSIPAQTHTYRAPGPYVVRAVATVYGCVFPHGPTVPMALPDMGVAPTVVVTTVTYRHG